MIKIGMTTFSEHGTLLNKNKLSLEEYASFFPIIELDTSFYAIQSSKVSESWIKRTPDNFQFILKAYKGMTKHWIGYTRLDKKNKVCTIIKNTLEENHVKTSKKNLFNRI